MGDIDKKITSFNDEYNKYTKINQNIIDLNKSKISIETELIEKKNILEREYTLLIIWFIIAFIFFIFTIVGILSNEMNSYVLYPSLAFLIFIVFYIIKNIYIYFNEL